MIAESHFWHILKLPEFRWFTLNIFKMRVSWKHGSISRWFIFWFYRHLAEFRRIKKGLSNQFCPFFWAFRSFYFPLLKRQLYVLWSRWAAVYKSEFSDIINSSTLPYFSSQQQQACITFYALMCSHLLSASIEISFWSVTDRTIIFEAKKTSS